MPTEDIVPEARFVKDFGFDLVNGATQQLAALQSAPNQLMQATVLPPVAWPRTSGLALAAEPRLNAGVEAVEKA